MQWIHAGSTIVSATPGTALQKGWDPIAIITAFKAVALQFRGGAPILQI
jgi:hypothetical protein